MDRRQRANATDTGQTIQPPRWCRRSRHHARTLRGTPPNWDPL